MNDSREFQDVGSVCSGRLSHVPGQPAIVPSPRGMLRHGTCLVHRETFLTIHLHQSTQHRPYRGMLHPLNPDATDGDPVQPSTERPVAIREEQNTDTIPTPRFARRPSTMNSFFPAEGVYPLNYMADQTKLQISELHFDSSPHLQRFHVGR